MSKQTMGNDCLTRLMALDAPIAIRQESDGSQTAYTDFAEVVTPEIDRPHESLQEILGPRRNSGISFSGWVGFFSYEFLANLAGLKCQAKRDLELPGGWFGRPTALIRVKNGGFKVEANCRKRASQIEHTLTDADTRQPDPFLGKSPEPVCNLDFKAYRSLFLQAREEILDGNVYQIKISQRFEAKACECPVLAFSRLQVANPSPESFLLDAETFSIVSCSPETVLLKQGDRLTTKPIGGTYQRHPEHNGEQREIDSFLKDPKELQEHNMLIDLERNDLSVICLPGSVKIEKFREVETYAHLHHLVSIVSGRLKAGIQLPEILQAMLPGGTITGCPKYRAMELIDSLEPCFRGPYTGSFGTIEDNGDLRLNLIIRSIVTTEGKSYAQAGGGIVVDSTPEYERNENHIKAKALLDILQ